MKTIYTFLAIISILLISCTDDSIVESNDFSLENEFQINKEYNLFNKSLIFSITEINDSRCPSDVICVWQGMASVTIEVKSTENGLVVLNTYNNSLDSLKGYSFELKNVSPFPVSNQIVKEEEYKVRLKITKLDN